MLMHHDAWQHTVSDFFFLWFQINGYKHRTCESFRWERLLEEEWVLSSLVEPWGGVGRAMTPIFKNSPFALNPLWNFPIFTACYPLLIKLAIARKKQKRSELVSTNFSRKLYLMLHHVIIASWQSTLIYIDFIVLWRQSFMFWIMERSDLGLVGISGLPTEEFIPQRWIQMIKT
jgi:hypothetical protein